MTVLSQYEARLYFPHVIRLKSQLESKIVRFWEDDVKARVASLDLESYVIDFCVVPPVKLLNCMCVCFSLFVVSFYYSIFFLLFFHHCCQFIIGNINLLQEFFYTHAHLHTHTCTYTRTRTGTHAYLHIHTHAHAHTRTCMPTRAHARTHVCTYQKKCQLVLHTYSFNHTYL